MLLLKYFDIKKVFQTQRPIISFHFIMHYSFGKLWGTEEFSEPREKSKRSETVMQSEYSIEKLFGKLKIFFVANG